MHTSTRLGETLVIRHTGDLSFRDALMLGQRANGALTRHRKVVIDVSACATPDQAAYRFLDALALGDMGRLEIRHQGRKD